jgi:hypothetical protein
MASVVARAFGLAVALIVLNMAFKSLPALPSGFGATLERALSGPQSR